MTPRISGPLRSLIAVLLFTAVLVAPQAVSPARACASAHGDFWLDGFSGGGAPPPFYVRAEGQSPAPIGIGAMIHDCGSGMPARVSWATSNGTAVAGAGNDYLASTGTSPNLNDNCGGDCPAGHTFNVSIVDDPVEDDLVAEHAQVSITTQDGRVHAPTTLPLYIVDNDGATRVAFAPTVTQQYEQLEHSSSARIPVFRAGAASTTTNVSFTLAGSGGDPAEPNDFSPASGTVSFGPGERLKFLSFTINNDTLVEGSETIAATISGPPVESPSTATFTIIDQDSDASPPFTRFHHPKQGLKYRANDIRLREIHTIAHDVGVAGLLVVEMALQQRRVNGSCRWWNGGGFASGPCGSPRQQHWLAMKFVGPWSAASDIYGRRFPRLPSSIGTSVRNYTAWTRAEDGAGNLQSTFDRGTNLSTFEVRRG